MSRISKDAVREIIEDFASEIKNARQSGPKPEEYIIEFRDNRKNNKADKVYSVPIELLRYRKDNGRIASDVYSYEKNVRPLDEKDDADQKILEGFLQNKDPDKTEDLKNSIIHDFQREPAIITSDGFLINGNRRRMAFRLLKEETHRPEFDRMRVVILPGKNDEGGAPTNKEIEQIENRYQLQRDGKSEYSNFDRALSIRRKIESGMSLEEQLRDDPNYVLLNAKDFEKEVKKYREEYLEPLACIDRYLASLGRDGYYSSIASNVGDREGRWQAFLDYYKSVRKKLENDKERLKLGVEEDEIGKIEDVAFKLIRLREIPGHKVHNVMRELPSYLANKGGLARTELYAISKIDDDIEQEQDDTDYGAADQKWRKKNQTDIIKHLKRAMDYTDRGDEMETPIGLLQDSYKKLNHEKMKPDAISIGDLKKAMQIAESIEIRAKELKNTFYKAQKNLDELVSKNKRH